MARTFTLPKKGTGLWNDGWHEITISEAEYGDWNDTKYIDIFFEDYPDTFKLRTFEMHNKETHEEFVVAKLFKFANAGIIDLIKSPDGKEALQYDDDVKHLIGKHINVLFYKEKKGEKEFIQASNRVAPTVFIGDVVSFSESDVDYHKSVAEVAQEKYGKKSDAPDVSNSEIKENIPF